MIAYHVVTERPMYVGQQITFDEKHHMKCYTNVVTSYTPEFSKEFQTKALENPDTPNKMELYLFRTPLVENDIRVSVQRFADRRESVYSMLAG